ncbi:MAG: polysaccharide deacetylase family protein [Oscillospiraceae bacterium]|nr:polysaccharide deacetylase family protein [Oscillospiraceae bacterium]
MVIFMVIRINKRTVAIFLAAVLVFCTLPYFPDAQTTPVAGNTSGDWGLSFQTPGKTPVTNVTREYLLPYDAYFVGDENEKVIYLTFDAGYENGNMPKILDALNKHNAQAVFFLVGNFFDREPELVRRMVSDGHIIGNHTLKHPDMSKISDKESFEKELSALSDKYREIIGEDMPKLYRPPQGKFSETNLRHAKELGYKTIFWSLAYADWDNNKQPSRENALKILCERIHLGAVVLLHSTSKTNGQILDELLTKWEEMGYTFGKIEDLVGEI